MADPPDEILDELYGAPLEEFTAKRDARAKELRKSDRATSDAIKKLRKPTVAAWAVNQLSRQAGDDLDALLAAGEALRQAQLGGGGDAVAVRSTARGEREAVETLVARAADLLGGGSAATLEDVRQTLHSIASDDEARSLVASGRLTEPRASVGLFGGFVAPRKSIDEGEGTKSRGQSGKSGKAAAKPARKSASDDSAAKKRAAAEARERQKQARAALRDAEREARERERAVEAAERERDSAQAALDQAEQVLARARREAEDAQAEAARRREELEAAGG
jgi:hypothetical protein